MNIHAFSEFLWYQWHSKTRHGVHSPFVYDFIERILQNKGATLTEGESLSITGYTGAEPDLADLLPLRYRILVSRIASYYGMHQLLVTNTEDDREPLPGNFLLIAAAPKIWIRLFNRHLPQMGGASCIIIPDIHKTKRHSGKWRRICSHPKVKMSIDLFGLGVIFFREEFKEKQHFVLRY